MQVLITDGRFNSIVHDVDIYIKFTHKGEWHTGIFKTIQTYNYFNNTTTCNLSIVNQIEVSEAMLNEEEDKELWRIAEEYQEEIKKTTSR